MSEAQMQHHCYFWFCQNYKALRKYLWLQHNNPRSAVEGAKLIGMGLQKGIADLCFLAVGNFPYFLELKTEKGKQTPEQIAWQRAVEERGAIYAVVRSVDEFKFWIHVAMLHGGHYKTSQGALISFSESNAVDYNKMQEIQYLLWLNRSKEEIPAEIKNYFTNLNLKVT